MIRFALRFACKDAPFLQSLARQVRSGERRGAVGGLAAAADAAHKGEPLIIQCSTPEEAQQQAEHFVLLGCVRPEVDELTGQRPSK